MPKTKKQKKLATFYRLNPYAIYRDAANRLLRMVQEHTVCPTDFTEEHIDDIWYGRDEEKRKEK